MGRTRLVVAALLVGAVALATPIPERAVLQETRLLSTCLGDDCTETDACSGWDIAVHSAGCREQLPIENGANCTAVCQQTGYEPTVATLTCHGGRFVPSHFVCQATGCVLPEIDHADPVRKCDENFGGHLVPSGSNCTAMCDKDYEARPPMLECLAGEFSYNGSAATGFQCFHLIDQCQVPAILGAGVIGQARSGHAACEPGGMLDTYEKCSIACKAGYTEHATTFAYECGRSGLEAPDHMCKVNPCDLPTEFGEHVLQGAGGGCKTGGSLPADHSCSLRCEPGYQSTGTATYFCNEGILETDFTCPPKDCGPLPTGQLTEHARFTDECGTLFTSEPCIAFCGAGYTAPAQEFTCEADGNWVGTSPACELKQCADLPQLANATFEEHCVFKYGSPCVATCNDGFVGVPATFECDIATDNAGELAEWSGVAPVCTATHCKRNQRVLDHTCVGCMIGKFREAGDAAPNGDTECLPCEVGTYRPQGEETCLPCPDNASTDGATGSFMMSQCKCDAGYFGTLKVDGDTCTKCPKDMYKAVTGVSSCLGCPAHSSTGNQLGANAITVCECVAGYTGSMLDANPGCTQCGVDSYKTDRGNVPCTACPAFSTTDGVKGSARLSDCSCLEGYTGDPANGKPCTACPADFYKSTKGVATCAKCPDFSSTLTETAMVSVFDCTCDEGYTRSMNPWGTGFSCQPNRCDIDALGALVVGADLTKCTGKTTTESCELPCAQGYTGATTTYECLPSGLFSGGNTVCTADPCDPLDLGPSVTVSDCVGKKTTETCVLTCSTGFTGNDGNATCTAAATFETTTMQCAANTCVERHQEGVDLSDCAGKKTLEKCTAKCAEGYYVPPALGEPTTELTCGRAGTVLGDAPRCEIASCEQAPQPITGVDFSVLVPSLKVHESKVVPCQPGYAQQNSPAAYDLLSSVNSEYSIQENGGRNVNMLRTRFSSVQYSIVAALDKSEGAVSIHSPASDRYLFSNGAGAALTADYYADMELFRISSSFYLRFALNGQLGSISLEPVSQPGFFVVEKDGQVKVAVLEDTDDFRNRASFVPGTAIAGLPKTVPANFTCMRGGRLRGFPPSCHPAACRDPEPALGVDFSDCIGKTTTEECTVRCAEGYTVASDSEVGRYKCTPSGFEGTHPTCVPNQCTSMASAPANVVADQCIGKRTDERCSITCKPGFSASSLLVKDRMPVDEITFGPYAAGEDAGCLECGVGPFSKYPCSADNPVTACRNWCADTEGCRYFFLHYAGPKKGKCCRVSEVPRFDTATNEGVAFYAMNGDMVVAKTTDQKLSTIEDLQRFCGKFHGMSLLSIRSQDKLERVVGFLKNSARVRSNVPIGYSKYGTGKFLDLEDLASSVTDRLAAANSDPTSSLEGDVAWQHTTKKLIALSNGKLTPVGFDEVTAVLCERSFECSPDGSFAGEFPVCTANQCKPPARPGTDWTACAGTRTSQTCRATCAPHRETPDVVYDYATTTTRQQLKHSFISRLPTAASSTNVAMLVKLTTARTSSWAKSGLLTIGGAEDACGSQALQLFTVSDAAHGCPAGTGAFAFGFGHSGVSGSSGDDAPLTTQCAFQPGERYEVRVSLGADRTAIFVNGVEAARQPKALAFAQTDAAKGYLVSYLALCHASADPYVAANVQYVKVWGDNDGATLTCDPSGRFAGANPCVDDQCPVPRLPLPVDFSRCAGKVAGQKCNATCHDKSPSLDIAFESKETLATTRRPLGYAHKFPLASPVTITFDALVSGTSRGKMDFFTVGGSKHTCCGSGLYAFATSENCGDDGATGAKFAIGFGTQCDTACDPPLLTACKFARDVFYSVKITYHTGEAKIFVSELEEASAEKNFAVTQTDANGFMVTALGGCHNVDHEVLEGKVSRLMVFSQTSHVPLTCTPDGTFSGTVPTCLDRTCPVPTHGVGIDFSDCLGKLEGESCLARCKPGFSSYGAPGDAFDGLWLEATDAVLDVNNNNIVWPDRSADSSNVVVVGARYSASRGGVCMQHGQHVKIEGAADDEFAVSVWVKLDSEGAGNRGCLIGLRSGSETDCLFLHSWAEGAADHHPGMAASVAARVPSIPAGEWTHVVLDGFGGEFSVFVNGVEAPLGVPTASLPSPEIFIGAHPATSDHLNGCVSQVRIKRHGSGSGGNGGGADDLPRAVVANLYAEGRTADGRSRPSPLPSRDAAHSALLWLEAEDFAAAAPNDQPWVDHRGAGAGPVGAQVAVSDGVYFDAEEGGLRFSNDSTYATVSAFQIGPNALPKFSFEAWVKLSSRGGGNSSWLMSTDSGTYDRSVMISSRDFGTNASSSAAIGIGRLYASRASTPRPGEWHHLVATWDQGGNAFLYKNGEPFLASAHAHNRDVLTHITIGRHELLRNSFLDGWVATMRFYGTALSRADVERLYRQGCTARALPSAANVHTDLLLDARTISVAGAWGDRRTANANANANGDANGDAVQCQAHGSAALQAPRGGMRVSSDSSFANCTGVSIGAAANPDVTLEAWVKLRTIANNRGFVMGNAGRALLLHDDRFGPGDLVRSPAMLDPAGAVFESKWSFPPVGEWVHVVGTWKSGGDAYLFVNGVPQRTSRASSARDTDAGAFYIGRHPHDDGQHIDGWVAQARVFYRALSRDEVLALYQASHYAANHVVVVQNNDEPGVRTCDGAQFTLVCARQRSIHIKSAFYGRSRTDVCTAGSGTSRVGCSDSSALNDVMAECEGRSACSIDVSPQAFGNDGGAACEGTSKYLEVDYECVGPHTAFDRAGGDVRLDALVWLDSLDMSRANGKAQWFDHRGARFAANYKVDVTNVLASKASGAAMFTEASRVTVKQLDISPAQRPYVSVELWFRPSAVQTASNAPFVNLVGNENDAGEGRTLHLMPQTLRPDMTTGEVHAFETEPVVVAPAAAGGSGAAVHVVGVWSFRGEAVLYHDGLATVAAATSHNGNGMKDLVVGANGATKGFAGELLSVRVYPRALSADEVHALYIHGPSPGKWMTADESTTSFHCASDGRLHGADPVCVPNKCAAPDFDPSIALEGCDGRTTGETCTAKCADGYTGVIRLYHPLPDRACVSASTYDRLEGRFTLQQCKAACSVGVQGCKEGCTGNRDRAQKLPCNALGYNAEKEECVIYQGCSEAPASDLLGFEYHQAATSLTGVLSCGANGRLSGATPSCALAGPASAGGARMTACGGDAAKDYVSPKCPEGQLIHVTAANFGRTRPDVCPSTGSSSEACHTPDALDVARRECDGHRTCNLYARAQMFGASCAEASSYLDVTYECIVAENRHKHHQLACESTDMQLQCTGNRVIEVHQAVFGRVAFDPCPDATGSRTNLECRAPDALAIVRAKCDGRSSCTVGASRGAFGTDCPSTSQYLDVDYECVVPSNVVRVCDGSTLSLACEGNNKFINVMSAEVGRHEGQLCTEEGKNHGAGDCPMRSVYDDVAALCQNRVSCDVQFTPSRFGGDACPATSQYLEVLYECGPGTPDVRTCEGETMAIACSSGTLRIDAAVYGRTLASACPAGDHAQTDCAADALGVVRAACDNKAVCELDVVPESGLQDACPGTSKFLDVDYHCEAAMGRLVVCEHSTANLACSVGTIRVTTASYGRTDYSTCWHSSMLTASCGASGALQTVKQACDGRTSCSVAASNGVFGDPCYGTYKYMTIDYTCATD